MIIIFCLSLFSCFTAQQIKNSDIDKFISKFSRTELPFALSDSDSLRYYSFDKIEIPDSLIERFIDKKKHSNNIKPYKFYYYQCPIYNDSLIGIIYEKSGAKGALEIYFDIVIYNAKNFNIIDHAVLLQIFDGGGYELTGKCEIDKNLIMTQEFFGYKYNLDNRQDRSLERQSKNKFKITMTGFEVIEGNKINPTKW